MFNKEDNNSRNPTLITYLRDPSLQKMYTVSFNWAWIIIAQKYQHMSCQVHNVGVDDRDGEDPHDDVHAFDLFRMVIDRVCISPLF